MPFLDWVNKNQAKQAAAQVPYRLLEFQAQYGDASAGDNLLINGDNLEALKALTPFYAGRVKCIYIDPPYNTRSAFEHYDDKLEHSQWLSMMYPRLQLLRDLLANDGSIWVSIDDNESHYLKAIMDEIFGRANFFTSFIWQKVDSPNDNKVPVTPDHEYILCYEKLRDRGGFKKKGDASVLDSYSNRDENNRLYRDRLLKKNGKNSLREDRPTMFYPLTAPDGSTVYPIHDDGKEARWSHSEKGVVLAEKENRLIWKQRAKDGVTVWVPYIREFAPPNPERPHPTILLDVKTSRQAKAHQTEVLPQAKAFDTVKPEQLMQRVLEICTEKGDLVLDSFLGSGTTAAVAHKMGRRYIGIEMGEHARTHCIPRLEKVIEGEQGGISEAIDWQGNGGFRFYTLGEPVFLADGRINSQVRFKALAGYIWHFETGQPARQEFDSTFLGEYEGSTYHLLYNGILGDKRPQGGNVLTQAVLAMLDKATPKDCIRGGKRVIYGEKTLLSERRLVAENIVFKQIPYDIKAR